MTNQCRYILHIGRNKTGTSALQQFFYKHRASLRDHGVLYPDIGIAGSGHHGIASYFAKIPQELYPPSPTWHEDLLRESENFPAVLLSSEAFSVRDPARIAEYFPPAQTQIVLFVREHVSYMTSWYQQSVKASNTTSTLREFVEQHASPHADLIERWMKIFGRDHVTVQVYDRKQFRHGSITCACLDLIPELQDLQLDDVVIDFSSLSGNLLFIKRCINLSISVRESLSVAQDLRKLNRLAPSFSGKIHVPAQDVTWLHDFFQSDRQALQERHGIVFKEPPRELRGSDCPDVTRLAEDWYRIRAYAESHNLEILKYLQRAETEIERHLSGRSDGWAAA